jgi:hypothetical protein
MIECRPLNQLAPAVYGEVKATHDFSFGGYWDAKSVRGVVATFVVIALQAVLVTTTVVAIIAFLLLTNSHI